MMCLKFYMLFSVYSPYSTTQYGIWTSKTVQSGKTGLPHYNIIQYMDFEICTVCTNWFSELQYYSVWHRLKSPYTACMMS